MDTFVSVELTVDELEQVREWLEDQPLSTDLHGLYERLDDLESGHVDFTEDEYDSVITWLETQSIGSGLGALYDKMREAIETAEFQAVNTDEE